MKSFKKSNIQIKNISSVQDVEKICRLESVIWQTTPKDLIPLHVYKSSLLAGSILLLAQENDDAMGFLWAQPAFENSTVSYFYMHMLGTHPAHRAKGVAKTLLDNAFSLLSEKGIRELRWTFDIMEAVNTCFYLQMEGVTIEAPYLLDHYGHLEGINKGVSTDRALARWKFNSLKVLYPSIHTLSVIDVEMEFDADLHIGDAFFVLSYPLEYQSLKENRDPKFHMLRNRLRQWISYFLNKNTSIIDAQKVNNNVYLVFSTSN